MAHLPVELWTLVFNHLSRSQCRQLLNTSRLFHSLALARLFSCIKIYFLGSHKDPAFSILGATYSYQDTPTSMQLMDMSFGVLHRVIEDPEFAALVKSVVVHAFSSSCAVFEQRYLCQALQKLPHLHSLTYFGKDPSFSHIAPYLGEELKALNVQWTYSLAGVKLSNLERLQTTIMYHDVDDAPIYPEVEEPILTDEIIELIEANHESLRALSLSSSHSSKIPNRLLDGLTHLEICVTDSSKPLGLDLALRYALSLESLSIIGQTDSEIIGLLPKEGSILPRLASFRITCGMQLTSSDIAGLVDFLDGRVIMRRLNVMLPGSTGFTLLPIYASIRRMTKLQALGIHTGSTFPAPSSQRALSECMPDSLEAAHISLAWGADDHSDFGSQVLFSLLDKLEGMKSLSYLHLDGSGRDLPLDLEELAEQLPSVDLIGIDEVFCSVQRDGLAPELSNRWTVWKVRYCVEQDFPNNYAAWLFKGNLYEW